MQISFLKMILGNLVSHFNLSYPLAFSVINLIANGGAWYVGVLYPYLIPLVATSKGLLIMIGFSAAVGW